MAAAVLALAFLAACAGKPKPHELLVLPVEPAYREEAPQTSAEIDELVRQAIEENQVDMALDRLSLLQLISTPLVATEANFRRVQLLLHFRYPQALGEAYILLNSHPEHALVPNLHLWLAQWGAVGGDDELVIEHTQAALKHARLSRQVAREAQALGASVVKHSSDDVAARWWLSVAESDWLNADRWLREAALRSSVNTISELRAEGRLSSQLGRNYIYHAARQRLLTGNMKEIGQLAEMLAMDAPDSEQYRILREWAEGVTAPATVGVLLPLSGRYARFGADVLRGIRLALSTQDEAGQVSLRVEDTAGDPMRSLVAYQSLLADGVDIVLGPLLAGNVQALIPYLDPRTPVMALTSKIELARDSSALFAHALPFSAQAHFMAHYVLQQDARRLVLVHTDQETSRQEATAFREMFEAMGGEVVDSLELPFSSIDFRDELKALRSRVDNPDLLAELWEELEFSEDPDQEIRIPVNFDSMYLALPGKMVSLLAGQLAYMDVMDIRLYGSGRWQDGHLLDDRGRYLSGSRFSDASFPEGISAGLRDMLFSYREVWGDGKPTKLVGLGYDSMLIVSMLSSRFALSGADLINSLRDPGGFPGLTGFVLFDEGGVGHKNFDIFEIRQGKVEPAT